MSETVAQNGPFRESLALWRTTGAAQKVKEFTLTAEVKHSQGLMMRLEYRRDWSDVDFFTKGASARDNQNTFSVGWVYAFSTRQ